MARHPRCSSRTFVGEDRGLNIGKLPGAAYAKARAAPSPSIGNHLSLKRIAKVTVEKWIGNMQTRCQRLYAAGGGHFEEGGL